MMKLSILVPCYNEADTISELLQRLDALTIEHEIVVVDDNSIDTTWTILQHEQQQRSHMQLIRHHDNLGKGAAVRTALASATGDIVLIQDADLEYNPQDYVNLLQPILENTADVVYGSRFLGRPVGMYFWNFVANKFLTWLTNVLFWSGLSDLQTCYKVMPTQLMRSLDLQSNDFRIETEITAKIIQHGHRIYEVPISYSGRTYAQGKKMRPRYGVLTIWALLRLRILGRP